MLSLCMRVGMSGWLIGVYLTELIERSGKPGSIGLTVGELRNIIELPIQMSRLSCANSITAGFRARTVSLQRASTRTPRRMALARRTHSLTKAFPGITSLLLTVRNGRRSSMTYGTGRLSSALVGSNLKALRRIARDYAPVDGYGRAG